MHKLYKPRDAARALGISYASMKHWIYEGKLKSVQTPGGHHRIPESEIDRLVPPLTPVALPEARRQLSQRVSARNQLIARIVDIETKGLLVQVELSIGGQRITSIVTAEAASELRLEKGQIVAAVIKSTSVMILRPG